VPLCMARHCLGILGFMLACLPSCKNGHPRLGATGWPRRQAPQVWATGVRAEIGQRARYPQTLVHGTGVVPRLALSPGGPACAG
jgi:hypothetical protein